MITSPLGTAQFKTSLEFTFYEFPYYDAFIVVCAVFQLALELKKDIILQSFKCESDAIGGDKVKMICVVLQFELDIKRAES